MELINKLFDKKDDKPKSDLTDNMEYNQLLLKALINETNLKKSGGIFVWITEYLGYFPFGQYQWLEINDKDISSGFNFDWDYKDLIKLTNLGLLKKVSEEKFADDKEIIKYKVNL